MQARISIRQSFHKTSKGRQYYLRIKYHFSLGSCIGFEIFYFYDFYLLFPLRFMPRNPSGAQYLAYIISSRVDLPQDQMYQLVHYSFVHHK